MDYGQCNDDRTEKYQWAPSWHTSRLLFHISLVNSCLNLIARWSLLQRTVFLPSPIIVWSCLPWRFSGRIWCVNWHVPYTLFPYPFPRADEGKWAPIHIHCIQHIIIITMNCNVYILLFVIKSKIGYLDVWLTRAILHSPFNFELLRIYCIFNRKWHSVEYVII